MMDDMQPEQTFEQIEKYKEYCRERCWSAVENALLHNQAQPDLITQMQNGIKATDADDTYSCGMRNGMRWCISLIDGKEPLYENCPPAQPEPCLDLIVSEIEETIRETKENGKHHEIHVRINGEMICFGLQLALEIIEEKRNERFDK